MKYSKKVLKGLSIDELEKLIRELDFEEETLIQKREETLFKHIVETEIVDRRFWKDAALFAGSIVVFQFSEIFPFLVDWPKEIEAAVAGLSAIASIVVPIVLHRVGCKKLIEKHYDEVKQYYLAHPEEYEKKVEECSTRFDEDVRLDEIEKERLIAEYCLKKKREEDKTMIRIVENASRMREEIEEAELERNI